MPKLKAEKVNSCLTFSKTLRSVTDQECPHNFGYCWASKTTATRIKCRKVKVSFGDGWKCVIDFHAQEKAVKFVSLTIKLEVIFDCTRSALEHRITIPGWKNHE
jgi:hypothetical protein